jgi:hypothetical protein
MARAKELFDYYEKVRERTRRVVELIPEDRFDWTASPGKFSLGDLVRHLGAIERFMYAENARLLESRYPGHGKDLADGREAVLAFFDRTHAESMAIFRGLTILPFGGEVVEGVAQGRFEIGVSQSSEIVARPGATLAGALPAPLDHRTGYLAAKTVAAGDAADVLLEFLRAPQSRAAFAAMGFAAP